MLKKSFRELFLIFINGNKNYLTVQKQLLKRQKDLVALTLYRLFEINYCLLKNNNHEKKYHGDLFDEDLKNEKLTFNEHKENS